MRVLALFTALLLASLSAAQMPAPVQAAAAVFNGERSQSASLLAVPRAQISSTFEPVQKAGHPNSSAYAVAAFALAMHGIDVPNNVGRLVGPLKRFEAGKLTEFEVSSGFAEGQILLEDIPTALYRIYQARRSPEALEALLMAPMEGAVAENRDDYILEILRANPVPLIKLATTPKGYERLWDIADWNVGPPPARRALIQKLRAYHWPSAELKRVALKLAADLKKPRYRS